MIAKRFEYTGSQIPCFFIDNMCDPNSSMCEPQEIEHHKNTLTAILRHVQSLESFPCHDIKKVLTKNAELERKMKDMVPLLEDKSTKNR